MTLEDSIRAIVREELARALGGGLAPSYSTESGCWPPRCSSRRQARDRIKATPGHVRVGTGRATTWSVSREAYATHHARRSPELRLVRVEDDEAIAARAIDAAGLRVTATRRSA